MSDDVASDEVTVSEEVVNSVSSDTPVNRAMFNTLACEVQEKLLDALRDRRIAVREKLERIAKVKTEKADITPYLKFEKLLKAVQKEQTKLDEACKKQEANVHKLRALVVEMGVG